MGVIVDEPATRRAPAEGEARPPAARLGAHLAALGFRAHVVALAVVLALGLVFVRPGSLQQADEGAAVAQAAHLAAGDGWRFDHPFPEVDPEGQAFPLDLATRVAGTEQVVAFEKHPAYPLLLAAAYDLAGTAGTLAVSTVGTLLAAVGAALVARRLHHSIDRVTLWSVGIGSPLLFDGYQAIAHTLGAAGVAWAVLAVLARERPLVTRAAGAALAVACAVVLRNEALLLAAALGCGAAVHAWRARAPRDLVLVPVVWGAAIGAAYADRVAASRLIGATEVTAFRTPVGGGDLLAERVQAFNASVLSAADGNAVAALLATAAVGALVAAVVLARRAPRRPATAATLVLVAGVLVAGRALVAPQESVPGLLAAFPVLVLGLGLLTRRRVAHPAVAMLLTTAALFAVAVAATQYANAGGGGWGGRYFAIGLPVVAPVVWDAVRRAADATPELAAGTTARRRAAAGLALVTVALGAHALMAMRIAHGRTEALTAHVLASAADDVAGDGRPVILTTSDALARLSWAELDRARWLTVEPEDLPRYAARLHAAGVRTVTFASAAPRGEAATIDAHYTMVDEPRAPQMREPWGGTVPFGLFVVELRAAP